MPWDRIGEDRKDKQTFLEEISVFEISPTRYPANHWMSVFQKAENGMALRKSIQDMCKAFGDLSEDKEAPNEEEKCALRKAAKGFFKKYDENWDEDPDERAAVMAKKSSEALTELSKSADELASVKQLIKKSIDALDVTEPKVTAALDFLSPIVSHKPVHQVIAELPAAARAQLEELKKSDDQRKRELEELKKSAAERDRRDRARELVQKSGPLSVPQFSAQELGELLVDVQDASPKMAEKLGQMLDSVSAIVKKSALIGRERGSSAVPPSDTSAEAEIERKVKALQQKAAGEGGKLLYSKAFNAVLELEPELGRRYDAEKTARAGAVGLGQ